MNASKRIFALLVALTLMLTTGCGQNKETSDTNATAESYIEKAQKYVDEKDYAAAIDILQLGLAATEDESLEEMLTEVIELQAAESAKENKSEFGFENTTDDKEMSVGIGNGEETIDASSNAPDQKQMADDIVTCGANCFYLNNQTEYLNVTELELLRRKTDTDYDEAHVSVTLENEYYTVSAEMILYYEFYDVGGWALEYYEFTYYQSTAKKLPITSESFVAQMCNYFDACEVLNRYPWTNGAGNYCESIAFDSEIKYEYWTVHFSGEYSFEFCDDIWHETPSFAVNYVDWSPLIGTWQYREQNLNMGTCLYSAELLVNIIDAVQTSDKDVQITYSGHSYLYNMSSNRLCADEDTVEQSKNVKIYTSKQSILGVEVELPTSTNISIKLPWEYRDYPIYAYIDHNGVYIKDIPYNGSRTYFSKTVPSEEVQDAIDKLNDLNNQ